MSKLKNIVKVIVGIAFPPLGILMIMLWGMKKLSPEVRKKAMIGGSVLVALIAIIVVVTKPTQEELATEAGFATAQEYEDHMNKQKAIETARRKEQKDIEATKAADPMSGHLDKLEIKSTRIELLLGQRVDVKMVTFYSKNGVKSYRADVIELLTKQVSGLERMISKDYSALPIGECVEQGSKKYSKQVGFKVCNNKSGKYIVSWFTFGLQDTYFQYEADEIAQPKQYLANLQAATPPQNAYILLQEYHKQRSSVELF